MSASRPAAIWPARYPVLDVMVIAGTLVSWTAWLAIQVPTYRHASGEHRQQLKWLYSGTAIFVVSLIIGVFIAQLVMEEVPGWDNQSVVGAVLILGTAALHSISPDPQARSSTPVPGDRYNARPNVASFSLVNGLWMRCLLSRITNLSGRSSILAGPSMQDSGVPGRT
jgi:hypothetical protein